LVHVSAGTLASAATSSAFAHAKLQSSDPGAGSTLDTAPKQVRLKFNEPLEPAFSRIRLTGPQNNEIPIAATAVDKPDGMKLCINRSSAPGFHRSPIRLVPRTAEMVASDAQYEASVFHNTQSMDVARVRLGQHDSRASSNCSRFCTEPGSATIRQRDMNVA
jgi:methionine-rich copper-binding protein CopC